MNIEELKSIWNKENTNDVIIPNMVQLHKANHPLDRLKRNMKNEWILQLIAIIVLAFIPQLQSIHPSLYPFYYIAYGFLVIVSAYYLSQFWFFYTRVIQYSGDTLDSLTTIYHEFRLNIERYHSFGFLLLPFCLVWAGIYIYNDLMEQGVSLESLTDNTKTVLFLAVIAIIILFVAAVLCWTRYYYGKYIKQLKVILDELKSS